MTLVALDVDPGEDAAAVRGHVERYDLEGRFAVPPQSLLDALVEEFGASFVTPPTSPLVLVEADKSSARLLRRGVKPASELAQEIR